MTDIDSNTPEATDPKSGPGGVYYSLPARTDDYTATITRDGYEISVYGPDPDKVGELAEKVTTAVFGARERPVNIAPPSTFPGETS